MGARLLIVLALIALLTAAASAAACGSLERTEGSPEGSTTFSAVETPVVIKTPTPVVPATKLPGFDFQVGEGTFWEYQWDYSSSSFCRDCRGGPATGSGTFRLTLGPAKVIEGVPAYEIQLSGKH